MLQGHALQWYMKETLAIPRPKGGTLYKYSF